MTDTTDTTKDPIDTILDGPQRAAWGIGNMLVVANNQAYALQGLGPLCALLSVVVDEERADQD